MKSGARRLRKRGEEAGEAFAEGGGGGDEAEDEVAVGEEVVKVAGVDEEVVIAEEMDGEVLVGGMSGGGVWSKAKDAVPAGVGVEKFGSGMSGEKRLQLGAILADAGEELPSQGMALGEEGRESGLRRGTEGEIRVGDDFEAFEGGTDKSRGTGDGEPGDFHLRKRGDFGEAAEGEGERQGVGGEGFARLSAEREVEEDFVDDEGQMVFQAEGVQTVERFGLDVGTGGIVGMNEKNGAGTWGDGAFEGMEVDEPAVSVFEGVRDELDVLKAGEKFEERIAGLGEEEFVTGIAKQTEDVRVGFAGAGGEEEGFGINGGLMVVEVVAGDFTAGGEGAFGLRVVLQGVGIVEGGEDGIGVVLEAALGGIGNGEVEDGNAGGAKLVEGDGEGVAGERPVGAGGEHGWAVFGC